ncbi:cupin domain-containing protein [Streptomyces sp. NPDC058691]|uniref:cupin domain-containing protein n=1 Tax=Streptomyces sp. NPDC058691 TaxID=3346601 RepID=UPI00365401D0
MTFEITQSPSSDAKAGGIHVPSADGVVKWFSGDVYSIKLTADQTAGSLGVVEAWVPPGGGPVAHTHADQDETFFLISGELEFLNGDSVFTAGPGDLVHCPRETRHRFKNTGFHTAHMLFFYTPGGSEGLFLEGGDIPEPGIQVPAWGPERFQGPMLDLFKKYGLAALPEA